MATHYLDFEDSRCRAALESVKRKPVRALVRDEEDRLAPSIGATCTLRADGKVLEILPDGGESHSWNMKWLREKLAQYR